MRGAFSSSLIYSEERHGNFKVWKAILIVEARERHLIALYAPSRLATRPSHRKAFRVAQ